MPALLYILLCAAFGIALVSLLVPDVRRLYLACAPSKKIIDRIPNSLFIVPSGIILGIMCVPFLNYYITLGLSYFISNHDLCLKGGIILTAALILWIILSCVILIAKRRSVREAGQAAGSQQLAPYEYSVRNALFFGICTVAFTIAATFLMFYTYRVENGILLCGNSTFSDLSPHTALVSSFGKGFNFPTQYMHFSGDGIQYHFLFYYFCGVLEYLGLAIDAALNIPSVIVMVCAFVLLGLLAVLLSGRRLAFLLAPVFVLFRSSLNVFFHIRALMAAGNDLMTSIISITRFNMWYKVTEKDDWGIWAINVYPNQRHLMLGISVIIIMIIIFIPFLRRMCISVSGEGFRSFAASRNAWLPRTSDPLKPWSLAVLAGLFVFVMPYFHGSCLIALLLILAFIGLFSESRIIHFIIGAVAVVSSVAQSYAFSNGYSKIVSMSFVPGFILGEAGGKFTLNDLGRYIFIVTGLTLILSFICAVVFLVYDIMKKRPVYRFILYLGFSVPFVFAFLFQVTLEMLANHKFIQVTLILLDVFVAILVSGLFLIPLKIRSKEKAETASAADTSAGIRMPDVATLTAAEAAAEEENKDTPEEPAPALEETVIEEVPAELVFGDSEEEEAAPVRPGNEVLKEIVPEASVSAPAFGDDEPEENALVPAEETAVEEVSESPEVQDITDLPEEIIIPEEELPTEEVVPAEEETPEPSPEQPAAIGELTHEAIPAPKAENKGLALPAWIALEVAGVLLAIVLLVPLTATGLSEWFTYVNINRDPICVNTESPLTKWVIENTDPSDVFLTPMWSMNRFILAGRPMYYGWPYYAWSSGHDTYTRDSIYCWLMTGCNGNIDEFKRYCQERNIRYVIADPEFESAVFSGGIKFNTKFFEENLTQVAYFAEEDTTIYKVF